MAHRLLQRVLVGDLLRRRCGREHEDETRLDPLKIRKHLLHRVPYAKDRGKRRVRSERDVHTLWSVVKVGPLGWPRSRLVPVVAADKVDTVVDIAEVFLGHDVHLILARGKDDWLTLLDLPVKVPRPGKHVLLVPAGVVQTTGGSGAGKAESWRVGPPEEEALRENPTVSALSSQCNSKNALVVIKRKHTFDVPCLNLR